MTAMSPEVQAILDRMDDELRAMSEELDRSRAGARHALVTAVIVTAAVVATLGVLL